MFLIRLILLLLLFVMIRRIYRSWRAALAQRRQKPHADGGSEANAKKDYSDLTEQGIDDADFEEIP